MADYPTIFCHGFCGWGSDDGANKVMPYWGFSKKRYIIPQLNREGFVCKDPSSGPWGSAWDRACELWAMLTASTVDYGKVHSGKFGHERFGRTYAEPLVPGWGTLDKEKNRSKLNFVGHSFGAPAVRMLASLLTYGSQEERDGTPEQELSPLFTGGRGDWVNAIVTLGGVNNGSGFASWLRKPGVLLINTICLVGDALLADTPFARLIDLHMEYWHIAPEYKGGFHTHLDKKTIKAIHRYNRNTEDSIGYEMQIEGMKKLNEFIQADPDAYYFAYRGCRTHADPAHGGRHVPNKNMNFICKIPERYTGSFIGDSGADPSWFPNDGFMSIKAAAAPLDEPSVDYTPDTKPQRGVWNTMPVADRDHLSFIGAGQTTAEYTGFIRGILQMLGGLE